MIPFFAKQSVLKKRLGLVQRMRAMVYSSKDFKTQTNLMKAIDRQTNQVADLTAQNKSLQHEVNNLLSRISVGNK